MFDWIPLQYYSDIYHYVILVTLIILVSFSYKLNLESKENIIKMQILGLFLLVFSIAYIGLRPVSGIYFADMTRYNRRFIQYQNGAIVSDTKDVFFEYFTFYCSKIMNAKLFFVTCITLYLGLLLLATKNFFKNGYLLCFFFFIASFTFWGSATNGIRNGIATSFFIYALSLKNNGFKLVFLMIAIAFHKSMLLPFICYIVTFMYPKPKMYIYIWILCIPVSLVAGTSLQSFFASFMEDDRSSYLTGEVNNEVFSKSGFRWDFILYSGLPILLGWYYIFKKNFHDKQYNILFSTYVLANAIWLIVIRANFSNRFAYLSWFMMAIVVTYPLLKVYLVENQYRKIMYLALSYFGFTFLMNVILN